MNSSKLSDLALKLLISDLKKDLGGMKIENDKTTNLLIKRKQIFCAKIFAKENIIFCGGDFVKKFVKNRYPKLKIVVHYTDGSSVKKDQTLISLDGDIKVILAIERTILNFLQHLSSVSSETKKYVLKLKGSKTKLLDTRKTTCGLRDLEKYATKIAGAKNHRHGLFDDILIKDNHIKALGGIKKTLMILRKSKFCYKIECDTLEQVKECIKAGSKYLLLDNMKPWEIKKITTHYGKNAKFEVSGGINLKNISYYSRAGADFISTSKITLSPKPVDISLDLI